MLDILPFTLPCLPRAAPVSVRVPVLRPSSRRLAFHVVVDDGDVIVFVLAVPPAGDVCPAACVRLVICLSLVLLLSSWEGNVSLVAATRLLLVADVVPLCGAVLLAPAEALMASPLSVAAVS